MGGLQLVINLSFQSLLSLVNLYPICYALCLHCKRLKSISCVSLALHFTASNCVHKQKADRLKDALSEQMNMPVRFGSSPSSCRAASTDLPGPLSPLVSLVHCSRKVFKAISCIGTELLYISSSWSSCLCSFMWRGPQKYVPYGFVPTCSAVSRMSSSSNLDSFRDGW